MAGWPPKKNAEYIFYVGLTSQSTGQLQANPTIAAGDFKVATDDAAPANLSTLPVVDADFTKRVKITLSNTEMNGDNVTVIASDAAGAEWTDAEWNIQTSVRQIDDLAFPTTTGRSIDVTATGAVGIDWGNLENPTTAVNLSATTIDVDQIVASVSGNVVGSIGSLAAQAKADVNAEVVDGLAVDTYAEPSSVPPATTTLANKIGWQQVIARNEIRQTNAVQSIRDDANAADIATAGVEDDGITAIRHEFT